MKITLFALFAGLLMLGGCTQELEFQVTKELAEGGDAEAQNNLGAMYATGKGVAQDDQEAAKWFRMSAEQGEAKGQSNLGLMYANGRGVPQDYKESHAWWSVAKVNGNEKAEKNLSSVTKEMTKEQIVQAKSISIEISKRIEANRKSENDDLIRKLNEFLRQDINKEIDIEALLSL